MKNWKNELSSCNSPLRLSVLAPSNRCWLPVWLPRNSMEWVILEYLHEDCDAIFHLNEKWIEATLIRRPWLKYTVIWSCSVNQETQFGIKKSYDLNQFFKSISTIFAGIFYLNFVVFDIPSKIDWKQPWLVRYQGLNLLVWVTRWIESKVTIFQRSQFVSP